MILASSAFLQSAIVIAFTAAVDIGYRYSIRKMLDKYHVTHKNQVWIKSTILAIKTPISLLIYLLSASAVISIISQVWPDSLFSIFPKIRAIVGLIVVSYIGLRFVFELKRGVLLVATANNRALNKEDPDYKKKFIDISGVEAGSRIASIVIICIGTLVLLHQLGVSLEALVAFGGAGGLALGLAAKDFAANFLGGLMINIDKPFTVGEWIRCSNGEIEGVVEDIGWRMTTIRQFNRQPIYVMNSQFATINIQNPGRMTHRRIRENVTVLCSDFERLKPIIRKIKLLIEAHKGIDHDETMIISLNTFNERGAEILIYCLTRTTNWKNYHQIKQDILLKVMEIIVSEECELAIPIARIELPKNYDIHLDNMLH